MLALKKHFDERARLTSPDFGLRGPQRFDVIPAEPPFLLLTRREILIMHGVLSVPSLLLRRFVFRMVEASAKRRCVVMNRKGPWEGYRRPLSPYRIPLHAHFHRERDVWVRGRSVPLTIKHQYDGVSSVVEMKFTFSGQESLYRGWEHINADDVTPFSPYLMIRSCANFNRLKRFSFYFWVN